MDAMIQVEGPLQDFCGDELAVWNSTVSAFSDCFETFAFVLFPFTLLAIVSSAYIGFLRPPDVNLHIPEMFRTRQICAGITFFLTLGLLFKDLIITQVTISPVMWLSYGVRIVSLLVHVVYLWRLGLIHFEYVRGPLLATLTWILTLGFYGTVLERIIVNLYHDFKKKDLDKNSISLFIDLLGYSVMAALQLVYFITLIRKNSHFRTVSFLSQTSDDEHTGNANQVNADILYDATQDLPLEEREQCPSEQANFISLLFFHWVQPLMRRGKQKLLNSTDSVYPLPKDLTTNDICSDFTNYLENFQSDDNTQYHQLVEDTAEGDMQQSRKLLTSLHHRFGKWYYLTGLLKFGGDLLAFAGPILLNYLVKFVENSGEPVWHGCLYAVGLFLSTFVGCLLTTHFDFQVRKVSIAVKSALISTVFCKTMSGKSVAMAMYTTGEITNLMSTDVNRVVNFFPSFHQFWSLPFQVAVTLLLLYLQVGYVFLAGLAVALLMILFNRFLAIKIGKYNKDMMAHKDERVKLMTEILLGIRVIKYNVWENVLSNEINRIRSKELKSLRGIKYFDAGCVYLWATTPVLISLLIFAVYTVTTPDQGLTAAKVFTVVALINMLISPLNAFPWVINGLMEAWVSLDRLENFARLPDTQLGEYYSNSSNKNDLACKIENGTFTWNDGAAANQEDDYLQLNEINLSVEKGQLIGVVGPVGSGKSSLLAAVTAGMEKIQGQVFVSDISDGFALATQEPWIQHATIRDNIVWGKEFDRAAYDDVIEACALEQDLASLPREDMTEVGENGVTLSGGQKSRIALARAIYQDKSVYLLDDPFSAVDQHVATHIYHRCIARLLEQKTVVLATHHVQYLKNADLVIVMDRGRVKKIGKPHDVIDFESNEIAGHSEENNVDNGEDQDLDKAEVTSSCRDDTPSSMLVTKEDKASGSVALHVYKSYWLAAGSCLSLNVLFYVVLMQASKVVSDWWLSNWVSANVTGSGEPPLDNRSNESIHVGSAISASVWGSYVAISNNYLPTFSADNMKAEVSPSKSLAKPLSQHHVLWYLAVYGLLAAINSIFTLVRAFLFAFGGIRAAKHLHSRLLASILRAPVSFFDVTPIGRIVNRFSSDMYTVDDSLPFVLNIFLAQLAGVVGTLIITCYGLPWFALLLLPLVAFYYYTQRYYRCTSRELKRLSSISLSPIYAHFHESLLGLATITAFRNTNMFRDINTRLVDINQRCNFSTLAATEWLAIRLQMMGVVMVTGVAFIAVLQHQYSGNDHGQIIEAGLVGLALSYALSVTTRLSGVITYFTETEKQMVAVERQSFYINNIPQERFTPLNAIQLRNSWPSEGAIEFRSVDLRYRPSLPLALDDVNFRIDPGEKIGIVGRTGSGKSSLFGCLFRMNPLSKGAIFIDGVNTAKVSLNKLRSKLVIIPQDPFLFSGSVRLNLDPATGSCVAADADSSPDSDARLWWALESCGLRDAVQRMGGLGACVGERGKRLSVGQRQLLCLARALLTNVQILCLDEATANVDRASEKLIQETMKSQFSRCTVLTIAHRVETVLDCNRVLVLDKGKVLEFDTVENLTKREGNIFSRFLNGD